MRKSDGFTLIELMIVVAIIAILTAIAIPAYGDFSVRAKLSEGFSAASAAKNEVAGSFLSGGMNALAATALQYPVGNNTTASKYVDYITVGNDGVVTMVVLANASNGIPIALNGLTMTLTPQLRTAGGYAVLSDGIVRVAMDWACASATHVTAQTRSMLFTAGTLPPKYLPAECR